MSHPGQLHHRLHRMAVGATALLSVVWLALSASEAWAYSFQEGDYWEFQWHKNQVSWAMGSSGSTTDEYGRYRVQIGPPATISGVSMYELHVSGNPGEHAPAWDRIGADGGSVIYGSKNGVPGLTKLFDASGGQWPGSGFFTSFSSTILMVATPETLSNEFYQGSALRVEQSYEQNSCQYFPGYGTICGGTWDQDYVRKEYWGPSSGPLGYSKYNSFSSCGGGFCSGATTTIDLGLVRSSYTGDPMISDLEQEPNQLSDAVSLPLETGTLIGSVNDVDTSDSLSFQYQGNPVQLDVHDLYRFTVYSTTLVDLLLQWQATATDLDLVVTTYPSLQFIQGSLADNVGSGQKLERIYTTFSPGTYFVGISGFSTPGSVEYTLDHNLAPTRVSIAAVPREISAGHSSLVSWSSVNAASCHMPFGGGLSQTVSNNGTMTVTPQATHTYSVTCQGNGSHQALVTVVVPEPSGSLLAVAAVFALACLRRQRKLPCIV